MEVGRDNRGQLLVDIATHVKVLLISLSGGIKIISSALTEGPVILDSLNAGVSGRSIGEDASNLVLLCEKAKVALHCEVLVVGSETTQEIENREGLASLFLNRFKWKIDLECHLAVVDIAPVLHSLKNSSCIFNTACHLDYSCSWCLVWSNLNNSSQAVTRVKCIDGLIHLVKPFKLMSNEIVNLEFAKDDLVDKLGHILSALPSTERCSLPLTTGN
jgi:hypothetical protein